MLKQSLLFQVYNSSYSDKNDYAYGSFFLLDSSSGCLNALAQQGAIDVYVSQLGKVELKVHKGQPSGMFYFDI